MFHYSELRITAKNITTSSTRHYYNSLLNVLHASRICRIEFFVQLFISFISPFSSCNNQTIYLFPSMKKLAWRELFGLRTPLLVMSKNLQTLSQF